MSIPLSGKNRVWAVGLILTILIVFLPQAIGGGGPSDICQFSNSACNGQVRFDRAIVANTTDFTVAILGTAFFTVNTNESMIVSTFSTANVTSVSDSLGTIFTPVLIVGNSFSSAGWLNILYGRHIGPTASNSLSVNFNGASGTGLLITVSLYQNVAGIGNSTSTTSGSVSAASITSILKTVQAGSLVIGVGATPECVPLGSLSSNFVLRNNACTPPSQNTGILNADNNTALFNQSVTTFTVSTTITGGAILDNAQVELLPIDAEPNIFNGVCTHTNGLCNFSADNFVYRNGNVPTKNGGIALNTGYCTGITTSPLTTSGAHSISGWGQYGGVATNDTGATLLVQFYLSTNVPSTSFGVGLCATGGTVIGSTVLYLPITGALNANRTFVNAVNAFCPNNTPPCSSAGTYYGWYEITPRDFPTGSLGWAQVAGSACSNICLDTITMLEIK